ncbi:MAG: hypothetical protein KDD62_05365 [Bdellovibrionales bacterium]|nr:hypothetical protein [Bdellovibrionales bacterium]
MLGILGAGCCHPSNVISNRFLEDLEIGSVGQWIVDKIGIHERRSVLPLDYIRETKNQDPLQALSLMEMSPAQLGANAARAAVARAGIKLEDIGLILCNCCTPVSLSPTTSELIAQELGIQVPTWELFSACPAFALHLHYTKSLKDDALPKYVLCVSTATLTTRVNYNDRSDSAIWGDGAAAWVVSPSEIGKLTVRHTTFQADPSRSNAVVVDSLGHFHQDGRAVRDFSVRQTVRMIKALERDYNIDWTKDIFIGHQANGTMLEQIRNNRKIPNENHWHNVSFIGNQAGAGAPAVLAQNWDRLESGQNIIVAVVGAGLSWGSAIMHVN